MSLFIKENSWIRLAEKIQVQSDTVSEVWVGTGKSCIKVYPEGAAEAWWYITGSSGNYTFHICSQNSIPSSVVVSGYFANYGTTPGNRPYHTYSSGIKSVVVEEAVSLKYGSCIFAEFRYATTFTNMDKLDTSQATSMYAMFQNCRAATTLDVSHFNTSNVTNMRSMFYYCSAVTSLDVSHFNTSNVTSMYLMFDHCLALTSIDVSHFNTASVTDMGSMFRYCTALTSLNVGNFNTTTVTNMTSMFDHCSSLTSLDLSNFNTQRVTNMIDMFNTCSELVRLDISGFSNAAYPQMNSMFFYCSKLITIWADAAKWTKPTDGYYVFYQNTLLRVDGGTAYDSNHRTADYACVDSVDGPGYFTQKISG